MEKSWPKATLPLGKYIFCHPPHSTLAHSHPEGRSAGTTGSLSVTLPKLNTSHCDFSEGMVHRAESHCRSHRLRFNPLSGKSRYGMTWVQRGSVRLPQNLEESVGTDPLQSTLEHVPVIVFDSRCLIWLPRKIARPAAQIFGHLPPINMFHYHDDA